MPALPGVATFEFVQNRSANCRFVEAPGWSHKVVGRSIAADPLNNRFRCKLLEKVDHGFDIVMLIDELDFTSRHLVGEGCILDAVQIVDFDGIELEPGHFLGRGEHVCARFARQPKNCMGTDFESASATSLNRVDRHVVMMTAVHPIERAVVHRLHSVFDRNIRLVGKFFKQGEYLFGYAVRPGADGESHNLGVVQGLKVEGTQNLDRCVRIGGGLKISEKMLAISVTSSHPDNALVDLAVNICPREAATGAEAAIVAKYTATSCYGAIDVRTSESGIDAHFLHPKAEPAP